MFWVTSICSYFFRFLRIHLKIYLLIFVHELIVIPWPQKYRINVYVYLCIYLYICVYIYMYICIYVCFQCTTSIPHSQTHHHHKHQRLDPLIRSVSRVTTALANVFSVFQLISFLVVCSDMISKGFSLVAFFTSVKASSVCTHLSCLVWIQSVVHGVRSRLFCGHEGCSLPEVSITSFLPLQIFVSVRLSESQFSDPYNSFKIAWIQSEHYLCIAPSGTATFFFASARVPSYPQEVCLDVSTE